MQYVVRERCLTWKPFLRLTGLEPSIACSLLLESIDLDRYEVATFLTKGAEEVHVDIRSARRNAVYTYDKSYFYTGKVFVNK